MYLYNAAGLTADEVLLGMGVSNEEFIERYQPWLIVEEVEEALEEL